MIPNVARKAAVKQPIRLPSSGYGNMIATIEGTPRKTPRTTTRGKRR